MAYITRNANLILIFCVVLSLTFLVGTTVFYQTNLSRINEEYNTKVDELKQTEKELNTKIKILDQVKKDLKLKSERETSFTEKFTEIRGEKETIEQERNRLQSEKESLQKEVGDAKEAKKQAEASAEFERKRTIELTSQLDEMTSEKNKYKGLYNKCTGELDACQAGS